MPKEQDRARKTGNAFFGIQLNNVMQMKYATFPPSLDMTDDLSRSKKRLKEPWPRINETIRISKMTLSKLIFPLLPLLP